MIKIGHSYDIHKIKQNRKLFLGGLKLQENFGLDGHSDADVLLHAITEALIGAMGLGDIGTFFPDTDMQYKDRESAYFLQEIKKKLDELCFEIINIDSTIYLEEPNLKKYKETIKENIARILQIDGSKINVKATRGEGLGFIGRQEGIAAEAVCLIEKRN